MPIIYLIYILILFTIQAFKLKKNKLMRKKKEFKITIVDFLIKKKFNY